MQDEMKKLARWHEETARVWSGCPCEECCAFASDHTDATATIRAAMGEIERLRESDRRKSAALQEASAWFLNYASQHDAKTPPDTAKAGTNYERAHYCETAAFDDGLSATDYYFAALNKKGRRP